MGNVQVAVLVRTALIGRDLKVLIYSQKRI
jgi:hypothetical protein